MLTLTIREAQARWSDVMKRVEAGEEILLTRYGRPVVKLVRLRPAPSIRADATPRRPGGTWERKIHVAPDADEQFGEIAETLGAKPRKE